MDKDVKTRTEKKFKGGQEKYRKEATSFGKKRGGTSSLGLVPNKKVNTSAGASKAPITSSHVFR